MDELGVTIKDDNGNSKPGRLFYTQFSAGQRTTRAATALLACLVGAGVTLFIPIAHFFLVPAFLIAGPILFFLRYKQADAKDRIDGDCPRCAETISIKLESTDKLPKWTYCPKCDGAIELFDSQNT